ncbi:MAG: OmpH family outer membrane protein [Prevotella sp.]|nr:OmpH family outer membrane protein [Prevotella sp.]MBR7014295.1 OmpH family outer membrane protein [Prevotella sp.]
MTKKLFLIVTLIALPMMVAAQRFGYFSYDEVLKSMPDYIEAQNNINTLRQQYDNEMKRAENEFNNKYEEFLEGQRSFAPSILQKRQAELQELMEKNITFRQETERLLKQAEQEAYEPVRKRLNAIVQEIGRQRGYAFILNTDNNACPYVDSSMAENITTLIKDALK